MYRLRTYIGISSPNDIADELQALAITGSRYIVNPQSLVSLASPGTSTEQEVRTLTTLRTRRSFVRRIAVSCILAGFLERFSAGQQSTALPPDIAEGVKALKSGEFFWAPAIAPSGPMLAVIRLQSQRCCVLRNGVLIGVSTISTGKPGHETPIGIFTVLQKQVRYHSNLYDSAPMPFMERLIWNGVAMHAGHLPGYAASHGCVRMPLAFAKLLYGATARHDCHHYGH